jgi:hypothetical protein
MMRGTVMTPPSVPATDTITKREAQILHHLNAGVLPHRPSTMGAAHHLADPLRFTTPHAHPVGR